MIQQKYDTLLKTTLLVFYGWLSWLMIKITLQYIPINLDIAFLRIKQEYVILSHYRIAFFIHVFSSIFVLIAGFTQFADSIRTNYYWLHKWSGWFYVLFTIFFAAPSGLIIGIYANGGKVAQLAFCLLALFWWGFTIVAIRKIYQKDISEHRKWMYRSFALAVSAITLRGWKYLIVAIFHPKPMDVYKIVAWLGWGLNWIIIELLIYKKILK